MDAINGILGELGHPVVEVVDGLPRTAQNMRK